jgi:hypothetical protein
VAGQLTKNVGGNFLGLSTIPYQAGKHRGNPRIVFMEKGFEPSRAPSLAGMGMFEREFLRGLHTSNNVIHRAFVTRILAKGGRRNLLPLCGFDDLPLNGDRLQTMPGDN